MLEIMTNNKLPQQLDLDTIVVNICLYSIFLLVLCVLYNMGLNEGVRLPY